MQYTVPHPDGFNPLVDDAGSLHAWLAGQGYGVQGVSVFPDSIVVESNEDLSDLITTYVTVPSRRDQLKAQLQTLDVNSGDIATLQEAVAIMQELLGDTVT